MVNLKTTVKDIGFTHEDFAALLDKYDYHFSPGDVVAGTVFSIEPRGALIDIGAKTAAYIPIQEMSINRVESPEEVLQSNETREFFILTDENEDGQLTLSIRRIEYMRAWERVRQLQAEDATVRSQVFATNRGGALVRIEGLRGFIPGSHISTRKPKEELVAEELPLKFLEVDEDRNRLVLSHRRALVERKMNRLEVGEVVIGTVRGIKPYGAFIDIGGVSGLLHISEISHDHIDTPHSVFNVNDEVKVMIIDLDAERGRISLSTKQLEPEPGAMVKNRELVYEKAEEMAAKFREKMLAQKQAKAGIDVPVDSTDADDDISDEMLEDVPSAMEEDEPEVAAEAAPEVAAEAAPEVAAEAAPEVAAEAAPEVAAEAAPEVAAEAAPEVAAEAAPEVAAEAAAEAAPEVVEEEVPSTTVE
ncbi:30S ribosomal protein S1 [Microcoleus sp. A2-C5]|uniref:30S ribosomal protein S1 n=1 Tax=Microcoleaceae TaxID=1892252 RepID=UPI002236FE69|nr:30S ribosomal protein S1 [Lyngbya sp. CCAP 1446/10]MCW6050508.1 30S ribosomal protein S1 [Lyngbya sp. CCAP 1446/10]